MRPTCLTRSWMPVHFWPSLQRSFCTIAHRHSIFWGSKPLSGSQKVRTALECQIFPRGLGSRGPAHILEAHFHNCLQPNHLGLLPFQIAADKQVLLWSVLRPPRKNRCCNVSDLRSAGYLKFFFLRKGQPQSHPGLQS